jgi:hypothetical protein
MVPGNLWGLLHQWGNVYTCKPQLLYLPADCTKNVNYRKNRNRKSPIYITILCPGSGSLLQERIFSTFMKSW